MEKSGKLVNFTGRQTSKIISEHVAKEITEQLSLNTEEVPENYKNGMGLRSNVTAMVIDKLGTLNRNSEKLKVAHLNVQSLGNKL